MKLLVQKLSIGSNPMTIPTREGPEGVLYLDLYSVIGIRLGSKVRN